MEKDVIKIGRNHLKLDLSTKHGKLYRRGWNIDSLVAYSFLRVADTVLDVGANLGFTSLHYLAGGAKEVHAVEPHPKFAHQLSAMASNMKSYGCALGPHEGVVTLYESLTHDQGHTLSPAHMDEFKKVYGADPAKIRVPMKTWDGLFPYTRFNYVKIDAEGSELGILKGGRDALQERKPRVLQLEAYGERFLEIYDYLQPFYKKCFRATHTKGGKLRMVDPTISLKELRGRELLIDPPTFVFFS